jgi:phosphoglycolate phosphatase-like HAD superfamily hydrolase
MGLEARVGGLTPGSSDFGVPGKIDGVSQAAPQCSHDLLTRLGTNHAAFQFLEDRAIEQLKKTPPKDVLIPQLLGTVDFVKRALEQQETAYHRELEETGGHLSESASNYHQILERQTEVLTKGLKEQERIVRETDPAIVQHIRQNLTETEEDTQKPMGERVHMLAARFSGKVQIVTDGDGTLTTNPDEYLHYIPASLVAEARLKKHGRDAFPWVFTQNWRGPLQTFPHLFKLVGREFAQVRRGVFEFFDEAKQNGVLVSVLTANFEPVTLGFLQKDPHAARDVVVWAVTPDDITSTDKENALKRIAYALPDNPAVYIGDGESDVKACNASDGVLVYFALERSDFEAYLQAKEARYFTYKTFTDIQNKLKEIGLFAKS